jgi:cardiolipin synthase
MRRSASFWSLLAGVFCLVALSAQRSWASTANRKQKALDEWRMLTSATNASPRVFTRGDDIRFYFQSTNGVEEFSASWGRVRVPTIGYRVNSALLQWNRKLARMPEGQRGWRQWREAVVIVGPEWRRLSTNLIATLTPQTPMHGAYYQGFLADRLWYRDAQGIPRAGTMDEPPKDVIIERHFSMQETFEVVARHIETDLERNHPGADLFLLMAPNAERFPQPLLLDVKRRLCAWLSPAALFDATDRGLGLTGSAQGVASCVFESHGLALIKNPVSSIARLGDLLVETLFRLIRLPWKQPGTPPPDPAHPPGMDLAEWEAWLDRYTGTLRVSGAIEPLIDGERFFPRLNQAIEAATNHISMDVFIFDRDDFAVEVANELKARAAEIPVHIILDRMGSIAGGATPPSTPMPADFVPPASMLSYLREDSAIKVRPFLDPWFTVDHSKVYLVDGDRAWLGGMNVGREYRYEWHDLMVELHGPVVAELEEQFRGDWAHAGLLGDLAYVSARLAELGRTNPPVGPGPWVPLRLLPTRTFWKPYNEAVLNSTKRARNYIYAENPYLFDKRVVSALVEARYRGVDVRVVLPRVNDFKAGGRSNLVVANYLREHGVRVYFYPGMTHVKALLVDDWACVGSGNLNHLSLRICQEQNVATSDPVFTGRLKHELFEEDFQHSYELEQAITVDWVDFLADGVLAGF